MQILKVMMVGPLLMQTLTAPEQPNNATAAPAAIACEASAAPAAVAPAAVHTLLQPLLPPLRHSA